jgi:hypothetical protein
VFVLFEQRVVTQRGRHATYMVYLVLFGVFLFKWKL